MTSGEVVHTEVRGRVLIITLDRPEAMNAIDGALARGLVAAVARLDGDDDLSVGVLTGAGGRFCSGMDLKAFAVEGPPVDLDRFIVDGATKPLIAAIEGFALAGGLELALVCDLLVAARDARLGIPEVRVGLFAAGGALFRLPARLPYGVAIEMALTADPISADAAHDHGLVARVTEPGQALDVALALAERIARNGPLAVAATKDVMRRTAGRPESEAWEIQRPSFGAVFSSQDAVEGPLAFAEKRAPVWTGR